MNRRVASLLLLAAASLCRAQDQRSPGYPAYQEANRLFVAQRFAESLDAVEQALRLDAKLVPALTLKAKLAMAANRNDLALPSLEAAVGADPKSAYAQFLLGLVLYQQNELRRALPALEAARRLNGKDPRAALYLGLAQESLGMAAEAVTSYEQAIRLEEAARDPQVETYLIAARLYLILDKVDEAQRLIGKALHRDKQSRDAHFESARLAMRRGQPAVAVKNAEQALRLAGGETTPLQIHALLARAYQAMGNSTEAARHAEAVRQTDSGKPR